MRILGIDLGSSSIKAVEMDSAFGRYDIHDYHEHALKPGETPEEAIAQIVSSLPKSPDRIVVSLPGGCSTFRNLQLPTRDKKAIQSTVGFELEDELPFPGEDSVYDYTVLSQSKVGSTIHVSATLKRHVVATLMRWEDANVDPDTVTTEAWAYRILLNHVLGPTGQESPVLLAQIGHEKTTFYLHWRGAPALIREISWGGQDLTAAIAKKYELPIDQSEAVKLDRGFVATLPDEDEPPEQLTPEQKELSTCLQEELEILMTEIRQLELMSKNTTHHTIGLIYLAGGTSLLPGLAHWVEKRTTIPTKPLLGLSSITTSGVTYSDQTDARFVLAASLSLCLVRTDKSTCINFRKGEFAKEGKARELNLKVLKKPLMAVGIVAASLLLSLVVQSTVYKSRLTKTNALLEKNVRGFFGQISSSALRTYMNNTSALRTSINKELTKQRELKKLFGTNPRSPTDFLNYLSSSIPKGDLVVDLIHFQTGSSPEESYFGGSSSQTPPQSTSMTFYVANPQMAEKLNTILGDKLASLERGKMEEVLLPDGSEKKWSVTFTGKPGENSYGK